MIVNGHWSFDLPGVQAHSTMDTRPRRYCEEITSNPISLVARSARPCSRQGNDPGDCPTCGVAWARHGEAK